MSATTPQDVIPTWRVTARRELGAGAAVELTGMAIGRTQEQARQWWLRCMNHPAMSVTGTRRLWEAYELTLERQAA
jgi:hypothetical protein